jgi:hypothetical protein
LHGPHHGAQQSSRTGIGDFSTISLKLLSVTASGFPLKRSFISSNAEHLPHFAVKPVLSDGILFFVPQAEHLIFTMFFFIIRSPDSCCQ